MATRPVIRETLTQYIHLLRKLTNQNPSNKMTEEIADHVVGSQEHLDAFLALHGSAGTVFDRVLQKLKGDVEAVAAELRKEFGSTIANEHGIFAASRALRHTDIGITTRHYADNKRRVTAGFGHHFGNADAATEPMTLPSKPPSR